MTKELTVHQKILGRKGLIFLIFLLNMTAPMSTDLYLSGFPTIIKEFDTNSNTLNYTLAGFFVSFAIGMLFIGPLSDKYGRKPILITGIIIYGIASLLCGIAANVESLILYRVIQAIGAGGMVSVSTAMVKDAFSDEERPNIIALLQMLGAFAPTVAPLIGAQIIKYFSWRETFLVLAGLAIISLIISICATETLKSEKRLKGNVLQSIFSLKSILVNKPFMIFLLSMAGSSIIYMCFLATSSYIYIEMFQLSETEYSLFFALNSLVLMVGPRVYLKARKQYNTSQIIKFTFTAVSITAFFIIFVGPISPYLFLLTFFPITFCNGFLRSCATNVLLSQPNMNAGGVSSIINFSNTSLGALGMMIGTIGWSNYVVGLGIVCLIAMTYSIGLWIYFNKKGYKLKGI